jgi:hypothetical protein
MKKVMFFFLLVLAFIGIVQASVFINEVEANPSGVDSGAEWIELYNNGTPINLAGWYLLDSGGTNYTFANIIINKFYTMKNISGLANSNENIRLYDSFNNLIDITGIFTDSGNNDNTYSRMPDGAGGFVFQASTQDASNVLPSLSNPGAVPLCLLKDNIVTLSANVTSFCTTSVIFSVMLNGSWVNFTGNLLGNTTYFASVNISNSSGGNNVNWNVFMSDCFNRTVQSGNMNFYVNSRTLLSVSPSTPDGNLPWYISEPSFSLSNPDSSMIWYRWDAGPSIAYSGTFGLENIQNPPIESAGTLELGYWSDLCGNESIQKKIFYIDLASPIFTDIIPVNGSNISENRPEISLIVDDIFQSNSGVNLSSIIMIVDGILVNPIITQINLLKFSVKYTPIMNFSEGQHNITISVMDNAGRSNTTSWSFFIDNAPEAMFNFSVNSPQNIVYDSRRVSFNISASENVNIEYLDNGDTTPSFMSLCSECDEYGFFTRRTRTMNEGNNTLIFRGMDSFGRIQEENVSLFVDSEPPRISRTYPRKGKYTNGSDFLVRYTEDDLQKTELNIIGLIGNKSSVLNGCLSGRNIECSQDVNVSDFNGQEVFYYFTLNDRINTKDSNTLHISVDTTNPLLTLNMPENGSYDSNRIQFNMSVSETVALEYYDLTDLNPRWRRLCNRCGEYGESRIRTKFLNDGIHEIIFRAVDNAGNSDIKSVSLEIVD